MADDISRQGTLDEEDDPLIDEVLRSEQLEVLGTLCKLRYHECAAVLLDIFGETEMIPPTDVRFERRVTWLVYMMATLIGTHAGSNSNNKADISKLKSAPATPKDTRRHSDTSITVGSHNQPTPTRTLVAENEENRPQSNQNISGQLALKVKSY